MKSQLIMRIPLFSVLLLALLLPPAPAPALAAALEYPEDIATRLQQRYDAMQSLSFTFSQRTQGQMSGRPRQGSGQAIFYKTGETSRMRWDYHSPDRQVLISDGVTFSMYFAELKQLIITPAKTLDTELTYSFFSGRGNLLNDFHLLPPDQGYSLESEVAGGPKIIKLVPKEPHSQVQSIHLWVTSDSLIQRLEIRDHFDTLTLLNLSNIEVDTLKVESDRQLNTLFSFTPPEGTEIIRQ